MKELDLLADMVLVLVAALLGGLVARRLRQPLLVGYLVAGAIVGPYGLRLVHDTAQVQRLAAIGVVLLLFALGLEFSLGEIHRVGSIATWGGAAQIGLTALAGTGLGMAFGWPWIEAVFFGFLISLSSTTVVLKTLNERGELGTLYGRIMIGILIVQDLAVVPMMVILPSLSGLGTSTATSLLVALAKGVLFLGLVLLIGTRVVPRLMWWVALTRSRELFLLSLVALGLALAFGTFRFGLSPALGAFIAGLLISESEVAHQALADIIPVRDTFATLFFASIGMLTDPLFLWQNLGLVALVVAFLFVSKFIICAGLARAFGYSGTTTFFVGAGLFQIGEFSFILAGVGLEQKTIPESLYSLVLAAAMITMILTPFMLSVAARAYPWLLSGNRLARLLAGHPDPVFATGIPPLIGHVVICGHGRVGRHLTRALSRHNFSYLVIDLDPQVIASLRRRGVPNIYGDAANLQVLSRAYLERARVLVVMLPDALSTVLTVRHAKQINPRLDVVVRLQRGSDVELLRDLGASELVQPETEAGLEIVRHTLHRFGLTGPEIQYLLTALRQQDQEERKTD